MTGCLDINTAMLWQIFIAIVIVCASAFVIFVTVVALVCVYKKAKAIYEKLEKEKESQKDKKDTRSNYVLSSILTAAGAALLFIILAIVANKEWGLAISPNDVVLTFVGILATFVVITNYAQVSDIKKDVESKWFQIKEEQKAFVKKVLKELEKQQAAQKEGNNGEL